MIAVEMKSGNFAVMLDETSIGPIAVIAKTSSGWRVMSRTSARQNSRTTSETPEKAASKYFSRKVTFIRNNSNLINAMGLKENK